ncbi:hypothetical protein A2866_06760 [Candidatus Roizmanbacteria bacterium RIFCSPHIGHO2_01_FULL_39_8]|uniref:HEPN domain-containing protein n=1 Tax=Candidatus Roizmanbacteria bacterium RIFCSPHIGHO2_01_FULL_39_8 TaxID=1802033 RepID=A0A1F7GUF4_9BACT|nr:MAG: hypothetical protein A2866_06760 [Candidatus Roizmanbacteria bacterium RIFCSPHIGHO2_01_FULL_39_8]
MNNKNQSIKEWLFFATSDIKSAEASFKANIHHNACFHSHQAAEKTLKALYIHQNQIIPKVHDLLYLLNKSKNKEKLLGLKKELNFLNQFYIPTRYPDVLPGSLPEGLPDKKDAQKAIKYAKEIVNFINKTLLKL